MNMIEKLCKELCKMYIDSSRCRGVHEWQKDLLKWAIEYSSTPFELLSVMETFFIVENNGQYIFYGSYPGPLISI